MQEETLTTPQVTARLGISRATFFLRLKARPDIKPTNFNPNLKKQHNPTWKVSDIDTLGVDVTKKDEEEEHAARAAA